jgi:hypothetical protein
MVSLGPLFDYSARASEAARDHGIALVGRNAGTAFMEAAKTVITERLAGQEVLAEEMRRACEEAGIHPHHHNAWGSLTNQLVKAGILQDTGRTAKSARITSHARRNTVWRVRP